MVSGSEFIGCPDFRAKSNITSTYGHEWPWAMSVSLTLQALQLSLHDHCSLQLKDLQRRVKRIVESKSGLNAMNYRDMASR